MKLEELDKLALNCTDQKDADGIWNQYYKNGLTWDDMPLDFLKRFFYSTYKNIMQNY